MGFLPVGLDAVFPHPAKERFGNRVCRLHGVGAGGRGNDGVGTRGVEAEHRVAGGTAAGQGGFVPVARGMLHAQHRRHVDPDAADPLKAVADLQALGLQRGFIPHMAAAASAAARIHRAPGIAAVRGGDGGRRFHPAEGVPFFRLDDADVRLFPGKQPRHKNRHPVRTADSFHFRAELFRFHPENFIFFHRNAAFPPCAQIVFRSILTGKGGIVQSAGSGKMTSNPAVWYNHRSNKRNTGKIS